MSNPAQSNTDQQNATPLPRWTREEMAARVARDIPDGAVVNLGIGLPTLVANHIPTDREVILQSENGVIGMGPAPAAGQEDYDLINAGKQPVTLLPGGCFFHHADSFAMMRGVIWMSASWAPSRSPHTATWPTGTPARQTPSPPWAVPWTWPLAPSAPW